MKKQYFLITVFLLLLNTVNAQDWEKYKAADLMFIAYYPGTPKRTVQKVNTTIGKLDMHMIMYKSTSENDNLVYTVIRSDYPADNFIGADTTYNNSVLDGSVNGAVTNVNGELIFDNKVKFNGYPGRSIKIEIQGAFLYMKIYLVDNSMFVSQVICLKDKDGNSSIKRFLDSFEIIKTK